jgi:hypothetical protein
MSVQELVSREDLQMTKGDSNISYANRVAVSLR